MRLLAQVPLVIIIQMIIRGAFEPQAPHYDVLVMIDTPTFHTSSQALPMMQLKDRGRRGTLVLTSSPALVRLTACSGECDLWRL